MLPWTSPGSTLDPRDSSVGHPDNGRIGDAPRFRGRRERLVVSVVTYAEVLTGAGLGHHEQAAVRGFFADLVDDIHDVNRRVAERAATLRAGNRSLKMPDALIIATADVHAVDAVLTADRRWAALGIGPQVELLGC